MTALLSQFSRLLTIARLVLVQTLVRRIVSIKRSRFFSPTTQPTSLIQILARRSDLYSARLHSPTPHNGPFADTPKPLIITLHGGGFIMNLPCADDPLASFLSTHCNAHVLSIDYRKAPIHPFPAGYIDVVAQISALLDSAAKDHFPVGLSFDPSKIVVVGSSAGGNLALGAVQDERLKGRVRGVVGLYPLVSLAVGFEEQMAGRPDAGVPDFLGKDGGKAWEAILDVYAGVRGREGKGRLEDARMSPTRFAERGDLPRDVLLFGCEHDLLCEEARRMGERLKGLEGEGQGRTEWVEIKGEIHAFEHFPSWDGDETRRAENERAVYGRIAEWIREVLG